MAFMAGCLNLSMDLQAASGLGRIEVGKPFPDLVLPDVATGQPRSVAEYRGHKVVLHVFASW